MLGLSFGCRFPLCGLCGRTVLRASASGTGAEPGSSGLEPGRTTGSESRISDVFVKFCVAALLAWGLWGCKGPRVLSPGKGLPASGAVLVFSVSAEGGPGPVFLEVVPSGALFSAFSGKKLIVRKKPPGTGDKLYMGKPVVLSVPQGEVTVSVARTGDYWEFAGGRPELTLSAVEGRVYYLGELEIAYEESEFVEVMPFGEERTESGSLPVSPARGPEKKRYLVCRVRVVSNFEKVRKSLQDRFDIKAELFIDCTRNWRRVRPGWFLSKKRSKQVPVVEP